MRPIVFLFCIVFSLLCNSQINPTHFQDLKYKDMSEILNTSEGALKASYHIATKKIEEYLTEN